MVKHFDHVTIVVRDIESTKEFFGLLGFETVKSVVISGDILSAYMGVEDIKAEHVTLALTNANLRQEVQLLRYIHPQPIPDADIANLSKIGFNHICFAVDNLEAELKKLKAHGIEPRNFVMEFHHRKLVYLSGPEGITVELAEWY